MRYILAILPVIIFYLIYSRYFFYKPELLKHIEAFMYGVSIAIVLMLAAPYILEFLPFNSSYLVAFLNAAFFEKVLTLIAIVLIFKNFPNFTISEAVLSSIMVALGFSTVENIFYSSKFGESVILVRMLFTVPLHISTTGMIGYYLGIRQLTNSSIARKVLLLKAFLIPIVFHGVFDLLLLSSNMYSFIAVPLLLIFIGILEIMLTYGETIPGKAILDALNIDYTIHQSIEKQQKYERWIQRSFLTDSFLPNFLHWRPGFVRISAVFIFMILAVVGMAYRIDISGYLHLNLSTIESVMIFGVFPISISIILIIVDAVNPDFFTESEIKIPVINDVFLYDEEIDEYFVTYSVSHDVIFLKTYEPLGLNRNLKFGVEIPGFKNILFYGTVKWENHSIPNLPYGSVLFFNNRNVLFYVRLLRYHIYRFIKGIVLNFKLPGFESSRKLYAQPVSAMTEDKIYENGSIIFKEGEKSDKFYMIKKGKVLIYKKMNDYQIITKDMLDEGEMFGEMSLLSDKIRTSSAICVGECVIAEADINNLKYLLRHNPDFAQKLLITVIERFKRSEEILIEKIYVIEQKDEFSE